MALLFIDVFDHSTGSVATHLQKYTSASVTTPAIVTSPVRTGAGALSLSGGGSISKGGYAIPSGTATIVGVALRFTAAPSADVGLFFVQDTPGGLNHLQLILTPARLLKLVTGGTTLATGATVLAVDTWYYLEFKATIHPTAGAYELRLDSVTQFQGASVNTSAGGASLVTALVIGAPPTVTWYLDDLYLADGTGPAPQNTFLGPVRVETLLPQTDAVQAGSNAGLTPSQGTDHGALVDEVPPNTTDYNSSATVGAKDTYNYPPMSLHGAILGVQTNLYVQKSDAAARTVCAVVRSGGTDFDGANVAPLTTFRYFSEVRGLNPATGAAWSENAIATLEAGMKVTG